VGFGGTGDGVVRPRDAGIASLRTRRASAFSGTGTESSRSKISASDPYLGALRIQSSLLPGTYIDDRSGLAFAIMDSSSSRICDVTENR
jgi:hypothetical protein